MSRQLSYPLTQGDVSPGGLSPMNSHWLFYLQNQRFLSTCSACSEVVFEFEYKSKLFQLIEGQTQFNTSWQAQ
jgi:hypothetical protein